MFIKYAKDKEPCHTLHLITDELKALVAKDLKAIDERDEIIGYAEEHSCKRDTFAEMIPEAISQNVVLTQWD